MVDKNLKTVTVSDLINILQNTIKSGNIKGNWEVWQATDEEGNRYSPVCLDGLSIDDENKRVTFYPLLVEYN